MIHLKYVPAYLAAVGTLFLSGCGKQNESAESKPMVVDDIGITFPENVEMKTEFSEYDTDVKVINTIITNNSDEYFNFEYGDNVLDKFNPDTNEWERVPFKEDGELFLDCVARSMPPSGTATTTFNLEEVYDLPLAPGRYRIDRGRVRHEKEILRAEFTITDKSEESSESGS